MRYYTYLIEDKETTCISYDKGNSIYKLNDLDVQAKSIQDLAERYDLYKDQLVSAQEKINQCSPINKTLAKILAPIVHPSRDVICLGQNYAAHSEEAEKFSKEAFGGKESFAIYFSKRVSRATANQEPIPAYIGLVDSLDYESELCVVLSKDVKGIKQADVKNNIFGYTVINDVSARNLQTRHKQWYLGKSLDGFFPMGPCIVSPDEIEDIYNLSIKSYVNNEIRQNSNTGLMIQNIENAICELAEGMTLQAGTLIAMGTPEGVGMGMEPPTFLKPGDIVKCEIEGIGSIENQVKE